MTDRTELIAWLNNPISPPELRKIARMMRRDQAEIERLKRTIEQQQTAIRIGKDGAATDMLRKSLYLSGKDRDEIVQLKAELAAIKVQAEGETKLSPAFRSKPDLCPECLFALGTTTNCAFCEDIREHWKRLGLLNLPKP